MSTDLPPSAGAAAQSAGLLCEAATDLLPRRQFDERLQQELDASAREQREFALVNLALDALREPASAASAAARGPALDALVKLLRATLRPPDAACRLGAERFAVLLAGVGLAAAHARMDGLRLHCADSNTEPGARASVSIGVASFPHSARSADELMQAAAAALSLAQRQGGNHVQLASIRFERAAAQPTKPL